MKIQEVQKCLASISEADVEKLKQEVHRAQQIFVIGNGGSNAIASHISQDYTKKLGKRSHAFSDPSRLTCYINDYGMENAYRKFIEEYSCKDDLVILISSAGESKNIVNCAKYCVENGVRHVILSGFSESNTLRSEYSKSSCIDFWVDSSDYGVVECVHQIILHTPA